MDRGSQLDEDDEDDEDDKDDKDDKEDEEEAEEEKEEEKEEKEEEEATDIKSNNPHLAGGEQHWLRKLLIPMRDMVYFSKGHVRSC